MKKRHEATEARHGKIAGDHGTGCWGPWSADQFGQQAVGAVSLEVGRLVAENVS
jgi:hypothetical protein